MATIEQAFDLADAVPPKRDIKLTLTVSIAPDVQKLLDQLEIPSPATLNALDADESQK